MNRKLLLAGLTALLVCSTNPSATLAQSDGVATPMPTTDVTAEPTHPGYPASVQSADPTGELPVEPGLVPVPSPAPELSPAEPNLTAAAPDLCQPLPQEQRNAPQIVRHVISGEELQEEFYDAPDSYSKQGYRPVRLSGARHGNNLRYATHWVRVNGPEWFARRILTGQQFAAIFQQHEDDWIPVDVSGYNIPGGGVRYAIIWERNVHNLDWREHRDVTREGMQELVDQYKREGFTPKRVEAYIINGQSRYISLWVKANCSWNMHNKMTRQQYQDLLDQYEQNFELVHLDAHTQDGEVFYSGIWWARKNSTRVRSDRDWYLIQRFAHNYACDGYVLSNLYAADVPSNVRYGGIWVYNQPLGIDQNSSLEARVR